MVQRVRNGDRLGTEAASSGSSQTRRVVDHALAELKVDLSEEFKFEGARLHVQMYGDRTPSGMFMELADVAKVVGLKQLSNCTDVETFDARATDGRSLVVVDFVGMIRLFSIYALKSRVAGALCNWVCHTVFSVQFGGAEPMRQGEFEDMQLADRSQRYRAADWAIDGARPAQGIYVDDVCSATVARDKWPAEIDSAMAALPPGTRLSDVNVVKIGISTNNKERAHTVRSTMRKAFGEGVDTRIVALGRCPGASLAELLPLETEVHNEFEAFRLQGIQAVPCENQKELFLATRTIAREMVVSVSVMTERYATTKIDNASSAADACNKHNAAMAEQAREAAESVRRLEIQLEAAATLSQERISSKDKEVASLVKEVASKDKELVSLVDANKAMRLALVRMMPSEMAEMLAGVL
jgi:hypothetical protein